MLSDEYNIYPISPLINVVLSLPVPKYILL